ncbi:hypothetical protein [Clostridium sp. D53t1_180928_C8]|jgi:hypothetical protein|uniref:hypothetical protein n=1 Tax=Clostridium sp. D53t1_180928_C8 TaxID=2787101 RepID=UPI0018A8C0CC|nr:hypothetical protein [Clostridium sp. D53t1_180928_C8]
MKVICDDCKKEFVVKKKIIKSEKLFDTVERTYFCCPKCRKKYVISYVDKEIKENIKRIKNLKGEFLRKELTVEEYEREYKDIIERNNSLNARYKTLYGR